MTNLVLAILYVIALILGVIIGHITTKEKWKSLAKNYETQYTEFMAEYVALQNKFDRLSKKKTTKSEKLKED